MNQNSEPQSGRYIAFSDHGHPSVMPPQTVIPMHTTEMVCITQENLPKDYSQDCQVTQPQEGYYPKPECTQLDVHLGVPPPYPSDPYLLKNMTPPNAAHQLEHSTVTIEGSIQDLGAAADFKSFDFSEMSIRKAFIRKVFAILLCQLLITTGCIALFVYYKDANIWLTSIVRRVRVLWWLVFVVSFTILLPMAHSAELRRRAPMNYILLFIFTLLMTADLVILSCRFDGQVVMLALAVTAATCLCVTVFALQTKWDFTMMGAMLYICLFLLILFGIGTVFLPVLHSLYACAGALLFSLYLVYDILLMMGGDHKYTISPEEYIFAALNLYMDIVQVFTYILIMFAKR